MRNTFLLLAAMCLSSFTKAQTLNEKSGWLFLMNTTKINKHWGTHLDVQFRTQDEWDGLRNFLFRPGITYSINDKNEVTLGYLLNETFLRLDGTSDNQRTEHRIWQQYIYKHKISSLLASHRFRTEQRFMEKNSTSNIFSQRFRYFLRLMLPLTKNQQSFETGPFMALQNEVFLNVQNKDELNGHVFDQNRAYGALGYRISKKIDIEAGYMNQATKGASSSVANHILQFAVYTRF
jgi:hypothetical protein